MSRWRVLIAAWFTACAVFLATPLQAHEVRPALLSVTQQPDGALDVVWKQPLTAGLVLRLTPSISGGLIDRPPDARDVDVSFVTERWRVAPSDAGDIVGRTIAVAGLDRTITDALIEVRTREGRRISHVATAGAPALNLAKPPSGLAAPAYLRLGVEHILSGPDHLLFVLGLLLLVGANGRLLLTVSAFTVAHSLTLAAVALGLIAVRPALIEVLVALSILFLAVELAQARRGRPGLTGRRPWLIAFGFGLLHGAAFAGALSAVGLPRGAILPSLLLFNLGVEIGQVLFIGAALAAAWLARRLVGAWSALPARAAPHVIGTAAAFWMFDRLGAALG